MKARIWAAWVATATGLLGGCSSGSGGGGGGDGMDGFRCLVAGPFCPFVVGRQQGNSAQSNGSSSSGTAAPCGTVNGVPVQCVPTQRAAIDAAMNDAGTAGSAPSFSVFAYNPDGTPAVSHAPKRPATGYVRMDMYYDPNPFGTISRTNFLSEEWSARMGPPLPPATVPEAGDPKALNPFTQQPGNAGVEGGLSLDFDYQSFGVWNRHIGAHGEITAFSYGQLTPASAVPTAGNARFSGTLVGLYVSPAGAGSTARADVTVNANFGARSLGFASSNTLLQGAPASHLDLSGTLSYAPGKNGFDGILRNAAGTLSGGSKGQFYGPSAQELGGAFTLRAPAGAETFAGAYGAKR